MTASADAAVLRDLCFGTKVAQNPRVQHGFTDATHNACCLLGPATRAGADQTGNEIGDLAASVREKVPFLASQAMTPWSTCMGSAVCSAYGQKYGDAYLKFAVSPDKELWYTPAHGTRLPPACEHFLQEKVFQGPKHRTPGIKTEESSPCSVRDQLAVLNDVTPTPFTTNAGSARAHLQSLRKELNLLVNDKKVGHELQPK